MVGRVFSERQQFRRDFDQQIGERQFATQLMDVFEVVIERCRRLQAQGFAQDFGGNKRIAVTVAAAAR